ncbi:MAG: hypothetical protein AB1715_03665 [Acidobacteriota bacterium]
MKVAKNAGFYLAFIAASALFLVIEHLTHLEFFLHLAAIPLEVLVAVFIVEKMLERREAKLKRRQLMFIKSHMFRSDMRRLFVSNFQGLERPAITMSKVRTASPDELRQMRHEAENVSYRSAEAMEAIIMEYVRSQPVWSSFMERSIAYNFEEIFLDMIYILHFIQDVKAFKERHPEELFINEAGKKDWLMTKVKKVLGDGIRKFLDYAIELKEKQPAVFADLMTDYEYADSMSPPRR